MVFNESYGLVCANVRSVIEARASRLLNQDQFHNAGENYIRIALCGDKGADFTKLGFFFVDVTKSDSIENLTIIGIYKGKDDRHSLDGFFTNLFPNLNQLHEIELFGLPIKTIWFIVADLTFLACVYGHCASFSTTYRSPFCARSFHDFAIESECPLRKMDEIKRDSELYSTLVGGLKEISGPEKTKIYIKTKGITKSH